MLKYFPGIFVAICVSAPAFAGEFNSVLSIGDKAPQWTSLPATDGTLLSSEQLSDEKIVVLVFTCNSCPYAVDVEDRLVQLHRDYANQSVAIIAVNVNKIDDDGMPAMKAKAIEKQFPFPYLFDSSQQIAKDFGAKYTPEFFVLDDQRRVVYMGAMDDSPDGKSILQTHVRSAIDALLSGDVPTVTETVPIGCRIRMERVRRRKR